MTGRLLCACGVALTLALPGRAQAGEVKLSITDGRVTLSARDATLREILIEWERVGGTRIVNRDRVPGTRVSLELAEVPEEQALATLLRPIAGYMASRRQAAELGRSAFSRLILMPGEAAPLTGQAAAPAPPSGPSGGPSGMGGGQPTGRPGAMRRVLPNGQVITVMDEPQAAGDPDDPDEQSAPPGNPPGMTRPPFGAPGQMPQGQPGGDPQADVPASPTMPGAAAAPPLPVTIPTPGVMPAAKPGAVPPGPPKPPGR
jgi:hypothetical protein